MLQPTLETTKFIVLLILVFLLVACGSSYNVQHSQIITTASRPAATAVKQNPLNSNDIIKPFVASAPNPTAVSCDTAQSTLAEVLLTLTNQTRASSQWCGGKKFPAAPPLTLHPVLSLTAKAHSDDMASADFFSHEGSNGLQVWDRALARGYEFRTIAENIAAGHESAEEVHTGWLNSPSHCENLMNPEITQFGAACTGNPDAELRRYWGTVLARPRNEPAPI